MDKKQEILSIRETGLTYAEIAREVGCSRQYVHQVCGEVNPKHFRPIKPTNCIFPGLRKWMNENCCSGAELVRRMGKNAWPNTQKLLYSWLRGDTEPPKRDIDNILRVTGMTYEECFGTVGDGCYCPSCGRKLGGISDG